MYSLLVFFSLLVSRTVKSYPFHPHHHADALQAAVPNATFLYNTSHWVEFMAVRPNGQILLPFTGVPELWSFDPSTGRATKVLELSGPFVGFTGITEIRPDVFALVSGNFTPTTGALGVGSWGLWIVDFSEACDYDESPSFSSSSSSSSPPRATLVQRQVPGSQFFLGVTPLDAHTVFVADGGQGILYTMSLASGDYTVFSSDNTSLGRNGGLAGVHGVHYAAPYVYYTNTFGGGYWKQQVARDGHGKAAAVGAPVKISALLAEDRPEGFATHQATGATYVGIQAGGIELVSADGTTATVAYGVDPPTDCVFGRTEADANVLYIVSKYGAIYKTPPIE